MSIDARVAKYAQDFGNWKVDKFLGQGGFGLVVRLKRERFGVVEYCAMKIVHLCWAKKVNGRIPPAYYEVKSQLRQDDLREVILMDTLKGNTNIVDFQDWDVKDWVEDDKVECDLVIRMELLESLDKILADNRKLSEKEIIKIGTDICRALEICHKERIIHRDIKPANIFLNRRGDYKLGDFGLSRITESGRASTIAGTPLYAAPEQMREGVLSKYGHTVDIYSLGLMLYQFANNNRVPFIERDYPTNRSINEALIRRISGEKIPSPALCGSGLARVILKACAFKPEDRYQTAAEFRTALETCNGVRNAPPVRNAVPVKKADPLPEENHQSIPVSPRQRALLAERNKTEKMLNESDKWKGKKLQDYAKLDFVLAERYYSARDYEKANEKYLSLAIDLSTRKNLTEKESTLYYYVYPLIRLAECSAECKKGFAAKRYYDSAVRKEPLLKDEALEIKIRAAIREEEKRLDIIQKKLDGIPYSVKKKWEDEMMRLLSGNSKAKALYLEGIQMNESLLYRYRMEDCGKALGWYPAQICYNICRMELKRKELEAAEKWYKELLKKEPSLNT